MNNSSNQKDWSIFQTFFSDEIVNFSDKVLKEAIGEMTTEFFSRFKNELPNIVHKNRMHLIYELNDEMVKLLDGFENE